MPTDQATAKTNIQRKAGITGLPLTRKKAQARKRARAKKTRTTLIHLLSGTMLPSGVRVAGETSMHASKQEKASGFETLRVTAINLNSTADRRSAGDVGDRHSFDVGPGDLRKMTLEQFYLAGNGGLDVAIHRWNEIKRCRAFVKKEVRYATSR